jgi:hypothetical protein
MGESDDGPNDNSKAMLQKWWKLLHKIRKHRKERMQDVKWQMK